jgi:PIN domain nuclease of toxin-antitoxin system
MLVAQAIHYGLTLVTVDPLVKAYQVAVLPEV